jgi:hypothetical protein
VRLFHDRVLPYGMAELSVSVRAPPAYGGVLLLVSQGSSECATFEVYALFAIGAIHLWLARLRLRDFREWASEQKATFLLLVAAVVSDNPLYFCHLYHLRRFWAVADLVATPLFHAFVYTAILVLFDAVLRKSARNVGSCLRWEVALGVGNFAVECALAAAQLFWVEFAPQIGEGGIAPGMRTAQAALNAAFVLCGLSRMARMLQAVDVTERFCTYLYLAAAAAVLVQSAVVLVLGNLLGLFEATAVEFLSAFGVHNSFALMMMYFHWPYQPVLDMMYETNVAKARRTAPPEQANPILESLVSDGE